MLSRLIEITVWNWTCHRILLDSSYASDTTQSMTALFENERINNEFPSGSSKLNSSGVSLERAGNTMDQESFKDQYQNFYEDWLKSTGDITIQESLEDLHSFQKVYAELMSLLDKKGFYTVSWARMYQDSSLVVDANDEADRDLMNQSAIIAQLTKCYTRG
jgi:hypothetical protein